MAKIENTQAYPTVVPAMDDLLIATDVSNNNETVTFLVSSLIGGAGVLQGLQSVLDTGNTATQNINLTGDITVVGTVYPTTITAQATTGVAGQILSSTGTGIEWINSPTTSCCSWQDTLAINDTTTIKASVDGAAFTVFNAGGGLYVNSPAVVSISGTTDFNNTTVNIANSIVDFSATGQIEDSTGSIGVAGQFLTSQGPGAGVEWSSTLPPASCCGLQSTIAAGSSSVGQNVTVSGASIWDFAATTSLTSAGNNAWSGTNTFSANGILSTTAGISLTGSLFDGVSTGLAGQVLTSTATGVQWAAASAGSQDLQSVLDFGNTAGGANANITISGFIRPGQITDTSGSNGAAGQILTSTGTGLAWVTGTCCNLQDTLSVGNSATTSIILSGAGINLTAPTVIPTLIQDALGSTGAVGQVLGLNAGATAIEWVTPSGGVGPGTSNQIAMFDGAGTNVTDSIIKQGGTTQIEIESTGPMLLGFLDAGADAGKIQNSAGFYQLDMGAAQSLFQIRRSGGTTPALTLSGTTGYTHLLGTSGAVTSPTSTLHVEGNITMTNGSTVEGVGKLIISDANGTGSWQDITGTTPINVTSAGATVTVDSDAYTGGANVGYVPSGGSATTFLRGDGTWQTPAGGSATAPEQVVKVPFYNTKWTPTGSNHYTFNTATSGGTIAPLLNNDLGGLAPSAGGFTVSHTDLLAGTIHGNPGGGDCALYSEIWNICRVKFQFTTNTNTTFEWRLWKVQLCPTDEEIGTLSLVAGCDFPETSVTTINCCDATLSTTPSGITELGEGEGLFLTLTNSGTGGSNIVFQGNAYINLQKKTP